MKAGINWTALWVFIFFFALVTVIGFAASRWQRGEQLDVLPALKDLKGGDSYS